MGQSTTRINRWAACEAMSPVGSTLWVFFFLPSLTLLLTSVLPCFRVSLARLVVVVLVVALLCLRLGLLLVSSAPPSSATKRGHFRTTLDRNGILVWKPENPKHFPDKQTNRTEPSNRHPADRQTVVYTAARSRGVTATRSAASGATTTTARLPYRTKPEGPWWKYRPPCC